MYLKWVRFARWKATVETILKQLEYVTKGHTATQKIFKFKMALFSSDIYMDAKVMPLMIPPAALTT